MYVKESWLPSRLRLITVQRIGQYGLTFSMYKFACNELYGIDESAQLINVANRSMNIFGWRPLEPGEHSDFMDSLPDRLKAQYEKEVLTTRPGIISSLALRHHTNPINDISHEARAESNLKDVRRMQTARGKMNHVAELTRIAIATHKPL